ncbi:MAG: hypothetical protein PVI21_03920 [Candidatus Woesebacteria bacterium]|jgi:hypothetical protein
MARGKGGKGGLGWTFLSSGKKTTKRKGSSLSKRQTSTKVHNSKGKPSHGKGKRF